MSSCGHGSDSPSWNALASLGTGGENLMIWTTLIGVEELASVIDNCVVVDCRHELLDLERGRQAYGEAHIPGAFFLHQDEDLAGEKTGRNGRHPLPTRAGLSARRPRSAWTRIASSSPTTEGSGHTAGRLWWLARWLGHERVAVLDGGIAAWKKAGIRSPTRPPTPRAAAILPSARRSTRCATPPSWCAISIPARCWCLMPERRSATVAKSSRSTRWPAASRDR
ncbi:MAG: rhodanese-like domain-containing protein [Burkholderiaceae bacterium]